MEKLTSNDLIISLGSKEFEQYFNQKILPHLNPIEEYRQELFKKKKIFVISGFVVSAIIFILILLSGVLSDSNGGDAICFIISMPFIVWGLATAWAKSQFKKVTSVGIIPTLLSYWGEFQYCNEPNYCVLSMKYLLENLKVYRRYDDVEIDDCIKGSYNDLDLKITELDLSYQTGSGKSRRTVRVFDGLMLEVDMNKNFTSHTVIVSNRGQTASNNEFQRVNLEDPEFEKEFDVHSTDQIESRYLLTTAFMRRLVEFKYSVKKRIETVFLDKKAYFFINYGVDMFELPLNKPVTDIKHYQNILLDLARILKIIDALKLEQKIGL